MTSFIKENLPVDTDVGRTLPSTLSAFSLKSSTQTLLPEPPYSFDSALIGYKHTWKRTRYTFQEKRVSHRKNTASCIWQHGTEMSCERHPTTLYWCCNICWDARKNQRPKHVEIHSVGNEKSVWTAQALRHLIDCHSFAKNGELLQESTPSSLSQSVAPSESVSVIETTTRCKKTTS